MKTAESMALAFIRQLKSNKMKTATYIKIAEGKVLDERIRLVKRFEKFVYPEPNTGCWLWGGSLGSTGYGQFGIGRTNNKASRVSYQIYKGEIPTGLFVCHTCDERTCVNPDHLFVGNQSENMKDCHSKNRTKNTFDGSSPRSKINEDQIREVRRLLSIGLSCKKAGEAVGIKSSQAFRIKHKISWKNVQ